MKQLLQNLGSGKTSLVEVPLPVPAQNEVLIKASVSLVSPGTERMLVNFGKASYLNKIKQQPDKAKEVLQKIRVDGLAATYEAVNAKLSEPISLGYSSVGEVVEIGSKVQGISVGDRVVSNGMHAEFVTVSETLCAKVPEGVTDESAAFCVVASIALQSVRLSNPTIGETFVVFGVGLIGLLVVQILCANGCNVIAIDLDEARLELAKKFGAKTFNTAKQGNLQSYTASLTDGHGVDGVIIAAASPSNEIISSSAKICRKRGRVVLVGVVGLKLNRDDFYEKEITFQVSCSYGPGRYDKAFEKEAKDYPIGFVRWTEQRNFYAVLGLLLTEKLSVQSLISLEKQFFEADRFYENLEANKGALGVIFRYETDKREVKKRAIQIAESASVKAGRNTLKVGVIGAGGYSAKVLIPALKNAGVTLKALSAKKGTSAALLGRRYGFHTATTDNSEVFADPEINLVVIATPHDTHASFVERGLLAGKHVFVEKPLAINSSSLDRVVRVVERQRSVTDQIGLAPQLMVGFNRRFSPLIVRAKELLQSNDAPMNCIMTVNAGYVPDDHWIQDPEIGGGRIIGEACHHIDLVRFLVGTNIAGMQVSAFHPNSGRAKTYDSTTITLEFVDGSIGTIHYFSNGPKTYPKERIEVFCDGKGLRVNNFKSLETWGWKFSSGKRLWRQDKGNSRCLKAFLDTLENGKTLIELGDLIEVTQTSIEVAEYLRSKH